MKIYWIISTVLFSALMCFGAIMVSNCYLLLTNESPELRKIMDAEYMSNGSILTYMAISVVFVLFPLVAIISLASESITPKARMEFEENEIVDKAKKLFDDAVCHVKNNKP